jgi:hypothetical protein
VALVATDAPTLAAAPAPFEGSIVSERPSFTTSTQVLPVGRYQLEGGLDWRTVQRDGADADILSLPLSLVRYGVARDIEVQAGWTGLSFRDMAGGSDTRVSDLVASAKFAIYDSDAGTTLSLLTSLTLPIGDGSDFGDTSPSAALLWRHALDGPVGLFGQFTTTVTTPFDNGSLVASNAVGVSYALNERWSAFAEHFMTFGRGRDPDHVLDVGVTRLVTNDLQVDAVLGIDLEGGAEEIFFGAGVAWRW